MNTQANLPADLLHNGRFPRANKYDARLIIANQMGLNPLWLTEWVCEDMSPAPGSCMLDLGCGRGMSSIFLAKEYGVRVWAADRWINPAENYVRFREAGVQDRVFPINADARDLPFPEDYFDAIICSDAYIYFGTDDLYLDYVHRFVKPGGPIGISVPGFMREIDGVLPEHLLPFWAQECWTWHTVDWWRWHWERTGLMRDLCAEVLPDGWKLWLQWKKARLLVEGETDSLLSDVRVLEADQGRYMGFIKMVAQRKPAA